MLEQQRVKTKALARQEDTLVATRCLLTGLRQVRGGETGWGKGIVEEGWGRGLGKGVLCGG